MNRKRLNDSKVMSFKIDFYEGMGSAFDLHGRNHFNDYDRYPGPKSAINQNLQAVGEYIGSSIDKFTSNRNLPSPKDSDPKVILRDKLSKS